MALNKKNRLKKKRDFDDVFTKGKAVKSSFLFIKHRKNEFGAPRFGFIVSAKVARKAVERNKIRRILSEAAREALGNLSGCDFIVIADRKIITESREAIRKDLLEVLKKIQ